MVLYAVLASFASLLSLLFSLMKRVNPHEENSGTQSTSRDSSDKDTSQKEEVLLRLTRPEAEEVLRIIKEIRKRSE